MTLAPKGLTVSLIWVVSVNEVQTVQLVAKPTILLPSGALFFFIWETAIFFNFCQRWKKMWLINRVFKEKQTNRGIVRPETPAGKMNLHDLTPPSTS